MIVVVDSCPPAQYSTLKKCKGQKRERSQPTAATKAA